MFLQRATITIKCCMQNSGDSKSLFPCAGIGACLCVCVRVCVPGLHRGAASRPGCPPWLPGEGGAAGAVAAGRPEQPEVSGRLGQHAAAGRPGAEPAHLPGKPRPLPHTGRHSGSRLCWIIFIFIRILCSIFLFLGLFVI